MSADTDTNSSDVDRRIERIDKRRAELGISKSDLARAIDYHEKSWIEVTNKSNRRPSDTMLNAAVAALDYYEATGELPKVNTPNSRGGRPQNSDEKIERIHEIDEMRKERDISMPNFSGALGYANGTGWSSAVRQEAANDERLDRAERVIEHFDEHGILPLPWEVNDDVDSPW